MNICIVPTGSRGTLISLVYYYSKTGHHVYVPQYGTCRGVLNWDLRSLWPSLLCKSASHSGKRNIQVVGFHHFKGSNKSLGEDRFLSFEPLSSLYKISGACDFIDFSKQKPKIHIFHTINQGPDHFNQTMLFRRKYCPDSRWISSTILSCGKSRGAPENICKFLPGPSDTKLLDKNCFNIYRHHIEFDVLGVDRKKVRKRKGFASYICNYHKRCPTESKIFDAMNVSLEKFGIKVPNFGGNIKRVGNDKYNSANVGRYPTMSPREAAIHTASKKAAIIFKNVDWAGGTFYYALWSGTPIICLKSYFNQSHLGSLMKDGYNCVVVKGVEEAVKAVLKIDRNKAFAEALSRNCYKTYDALHSTSHLQAFDKYVRNVT